MKKWLGTIFMAALAIGAQAVTITMEDVNTSRLLDGPGSGNWDGQGDTTAVHILNVGTKATSTGYNVHSGIAFQMTGASAADLTSADFSISYTGKTGNPSAWNVDVYVFTRDASSSAFLASDYENGTKIMDNFVTTSSAIEVKSLDATGKANLLSYLQSNWVENEYVFITLKSDDSDFNIGADINNTYNFGGSITTWTAEGSDAQLRVREGDVLVFSEDFNGQSISHKDIGYATFGGASPDVVVGGWFAADNHVAIDNELQLTNYGDSRSRGAGIWLDSSGWGIGGIGTVAVKFDVLDYVAGGVDSESFFQAYYANGVDVSSSVGVDVHGGGGEDPAYTVDSGTPTIGTIGARNTITTNVNDAEFTFDLTGQENIALVFHNKSALGDTTMPVYSVDNLTVMVIPPPTGTLITIQ